MRTRDRDAPSANGGAAAPRTAGAPAAPWPQAAGERLPSVRRERRPALAALAVLLILGGALTSTMLVLQSGDRVSAVRIAKRVPAGTVIPASAIQEIRVAKDPGVNYVLWAQRGQLTGYYAATDLVPGSVLVGQMLTRRGMVQPGQVVVGLSLKNGQYPTGIRVGDHVQAYLAGGNGTTGGRGLQAQVQALGSAPLVADARVYGVAAEERSGSGNRSVSIVVNQLGAAAVARAASAGEVVLVLVPRPAAP